MLTISLKSSEAALLGKVLDRFRADADRRARGSTIDAASLLYGGARDAADVIVAKLQAARRAAVDGPLVSVDGREPCNLREFLRVNAFELDEQRAILDGLRDSGRYLGGGGARGEYVVELA